MPRLATAVAKRATDTIRTRASRSRVITSPHRPSRLSSTPEHLNAADFNLGPLFVHTHEAVVVVNVDSERVVVWNPAAEHIFGWPAAEAIGQSVAVLISPAIVPLHKASVALQRRAEAQGSVDAGRPYELTASSRDGTPCRLGLSLAPVERPGVPSRYVLIVLHELSEPATASPAARLVEADLERAERTLAHHQRDVEAGVEELERATRRLRVSLRHLTVRARRQRPDQLDRQSRVTAIRLEQVERGLRGLATRSALAAGTLSLNRERVNLVPLVHQGVARVRAHGTHFRLNTALPQGLTATVDPARFEQVLEALLHQATTRCRGGCWIDVDLRRPLAGQARLEVRDFGRPVSGADRQVLMAGGKGDPDLGLARSLVELHGGRLQFEFPADGGVRAVVTLPTQRGRVLA